MFWFAATSWGVMQEGGVCRDLRRAVRCVWLAFVFVMAAGVPGQLRAQTLISVPFTNGFIGTRGPSAGTANDVLTFATLGIARVFFIQNSSTNVFELQGNDIPGTLRIVRSDGSTLDMPASANWRNSGGTTFLIGILPRPTSPITFTYATGSVQITDGSAAGGSSVGGYVAAYTGAMLADGASTSGNAAQAQVLSGLNSYLSTVVASRPAGPVTVTPLTTSNATPTITGTATLATGETLSVVANGVQYTANTTPAVIRSGTNWSLALASPLPPGTYSITATITNTDGFTLSDGTENELVITSPGGTVTMGGSFTANDKVYDGETAATGNTTSLTLAGVAPNDNVTIAAVTFAFASATAASGKVVVITGVTLGGIDAALYSVDLANAPTASAAITPAPMTIAGSFTAANKVFDGTTAATISTNTLALAGVLKNDDVALTGVSAAFADAAVGSSKTVSLATANLSGTTAQNYTLSLAGAPTTTADITSIAPPSAARNVTATAGDGNVAVSWQVPVDAGCSAISGYVIEYRADQQDSWTSVTVAATPTATSLAGLTNGMVYHVRVAALNLCGASVFSGIVGPVVPTGPNRDHMGKPTVAAPGTGSITTGGVKRPAPIEIVQDTIVRLDGDPISLSLRAGGSAEGASPIDATHTLLLEHGGWFGASGSGFAPGTFASIYLVDSVGTSFLLDTVEINADGTFTITAAIAATLAVGYYTVQINGIDSTLTPRSVAIGVEVALPPAELELEAVPDDTSPTVGGTVTITLTVTNRGPGPAIDVVIPRAFREPGFEIVKTTPLEGTFNDVTQDWTIDRIEPGATARLLLTVIVTPRGTQP